MEEKIFWGLVNEKAHKLYEKAYKKSSYLMVGAALCFIALVYWHYYLGGAWIDSISSSWKQLLVSLILWSITVILRMLFWAALLLTILKAYRRYRKKDFNPYRVLGIPEGAGREDVENAYRRLYQKYHPNHNPWHKVKNRLKDIDRAHEMLMKECGEEPKVEIVR